MIAVSSSWTIFTTCWPGVRLFVTSTPAERSRTLATKSLTTRKLTSASRRARRISRIARERSSSVRIPRPRRSPREACSLSESVSNMERPESVARHFWGPDNGGGRYGRRRQGRNDHRQPPGELREGGPGGGHGGRTDDPRDLRRRRHLDELRGRGRPHHDVPHDRQHRLRRRALRPLRAGRPHAISWTGRW